VKSEKKENRRQGKDRSGETENRGRGERRQKIGDRIQETGDRRKDRRGEAEREDRR